MKTVNVTIQGVTPVIQHKFSEEFGEESKKASRRVVVDRGTPREQAEKVVYRDKEGHFYFPGTWIIGTITNAASNHKMKGSRKSAKYIIPAAVRVGELTVPLLNGHSNGNGNGDEAVEDALLHELIKDYEVDSRPVTIPSTKGRIMRHRPRFDEWSARFSLIINNDLLPEEFVHQLLTEAGLQYGMGDYRPTYGTFRIVHWELVTD